MKTIFNFLFPSLVLLCIILLITIFILPQESTSQLHSFSQAEILFSGTYGSPKGRTKHFVVYHYKNINSGPNDRIYLVVTDEDGPVLLSTE